MARSGDRVLGHHLPFAGRQGAGLVQDLVRHGELADVVQQRGMGDPLRLVGLETEQHGDPSRQVDDVLGMVVRVVVALLDRRGERLHGGRGPALGLEHRQLALDVGVGDRHPALAGALGEEQRAVGLLEQGIGVERLVPLCDAERAGADERAGHRVAHALGDRAGGRLVAAGQQQHELVAAVARDLVVRAQLALQEPGDLP
jgi:hypothetical protein